VLRTALLLCAAALALLGATLIVHGALGAGWYALGFSALIVIGTVFERWRYRPGSAPAGADWQPTGERFEDPQTGKTVQVFYDPRSGQRRYVSDFTETR
jgi:hypothetical protein